eukprot:15247857-Alexandrium_andersonii.AAC.1
MLRRCLRRRAYRTARSSCSVARPRDAWPCFAQAWTKKRDMKYPEEKRAQIVDKCIKDKLWTWDPMFPNDKGERFFLIRDRELAGTPYRATMHPR